MQAGGKDGAKRKRRQGENAVDDYHSRQAVQSPAAILTMRSTSP